ncbi:ABC transporter permease [Synechococcus sp. PCC 7335]|uniref:ABC transporter permease n=1 Tax=Synechococcus sp. (strain ATCC 29403 / PCC 7335) TaxID=91464 RepID=UPI0002D4F086|nr:ABC transporter permease [Synechococcus sp. PCC 7335]
MDLVTTLSTTWSKIWTIARNVFLEVIRDRILYVVGIFAIIMVMAIVLLPEVAAGTEDKLILDTGLAAINLLSLLVVVFVGTSLINKEIEKKTVLVLIAKPVSRTEFILGKHFGLSLVMAALIGALTLLMLGLFSISGIPYQLDLMLLAISFMFLEMVLLIAAAIMFGVITSTVLATLMTLALFAVGHETRNILAFDQIAESESFRRVAEGLFLVLPDLERLNLKNEIANGFVAPPSGGGLLENAVYGLIYTVLLLTVTVTVFESRQF